MTRGRGCWLLLAGLLTACPRPAPRPAEPPDPDDRRRPFLWRVDAPAGPSYLLGSFHIGVEPDEVIPPSVWTKVDGARTVVLEVDIAVPEALGIERQPPGRSLRQDMTPEQWRRLVELLELDAEAAARLEEVRLWALVTTIIQELLPETRSIDDVIQERARARGGRLRFLEDIGTQAALLHKYMTADLLIHLLEDREGQRRKLAAQADAYRSGDEQRMFAESLDPKVFSNPEQREEVVFARNRRWLPAIERAVRGGGAFVAVGCSHLIGDQGVVALLRARGLEVTRIDR